jgi:hypothetical protein
VRERCAKVAKKKQNRNRVNLEEPVHQATNLKQSTALLRISPEAAVSESALIGWREPVSAAYFGGPNSAIISVPVFS